MINSPALPGPLSFAALPPVLSFLPITTLNSLDFISSNLLLSLNNKYPAVDTFQNRRCPDAAEMATLVEAWVLPLLLGVSYQRPSPTSVGKVQPGGLSEFLGKALQRRNGIVGDFDSSPVNKYCPFCFGQMRHETLRGYRITTLAVREGPLREEVCGRPSHWRVEGVRTGGQT